MGMKAQREQLSPSSSSYERQREQQRPKAAAAQDAAAVQDAVGPGEQPAAQPDLKQFATKFFSAFGGKRLDEMASMYAEDVQFKDPIFEYDSRAGTMKMWSSLLAIGEDLKVNYQVTSVEGEQVKGRWVADYKLNGRPVHNEVDNTLTIVDGEIVASEDQFDFVAWARQAIPGGGMAAFAPVGWLMKAVMRLGINFG